MINVIASIKVKSDKIKEFLTIFKANVPAVKKEKGCIEYFPSMDFDSGLSAQKKDSNIVTIIEKWESIEDLKDHLKSSHMDSYREKVKDIVESVELKILEEA